MSDGQNHEVPEFVTPETCFTSKNVPLKMPQTLAALALPALGMPADQAAGNRQLDLTGGTQARLTSMTWDVLQSRRRASQVKPHPLPDMRYSRWLSFPRGR
ncbi:hypothetical protein ATN37_02075 [Rhodococcus sp. MH15]|nr:hypothetical protein [Rhodococcus sp. MH15]